MGEQLAPPSVPSEGRCYPARVTTTRPRTRRSPAGRPPRASSSTVATADELDAAILRYLRQKPNETVPLDPLAKELGVEPFKIQLAVERLGRLRMVVVPFIEPGTAGGATLAEKGLRWLINREGGRPSEVPVAYKLATDRVRAEDEAARLPRAQVYGPRR
jgi:hypothetical protein